MKKRTITEEELENLLEKNGLDYYTDCESFGWDMRTLEVTINGKYYGVEYYKSLDEYLEYMSDVISPEDDEEWDEWIEENKDEFMTKEELKKYKESIGEKVFQEED